MNNPIKPGGILDTVIQQVKPVAKDIKKQIAGEEVSLEVAKATEQKKSVQNPNAQKDKEDMLKALYGTSEENAQKPVDAIQKAAHSAGSGQAEVQKQKNMTPEEVQKMQQLKQQLHKETYYDPTFNPPKKQEEEERPVEKLEREKQEENMKLMEKQEEKEKKKPIAVSREQNKAEQFRGASG